MKILYFNWVPTRAFHKDGGGVSIYQRNLLQEFSTDKELEVYYLTTSYAQDLITRKPYIRKVKQSTIDNIHEYEIVNAPILAPSFFSFNVIDQYFENDETISLISDFMDKFGPFNVIHFNNLEGISAKVLELKKRFKETKFIISLHNYFPFCAQVNLWYRDRENCLDFEHGKKCLDCNLFPVDYQVIKLQRACPSLVQHKRLFNGLRKIYHRLNLKPAPVKAKVEEANHYLRRQNYVNLINSYVDIVLCVSKRVEEIAIKMGIKKELCHVEYIGTRHADYANNFKNKIKHDGTLTMGYLGYMRHDKGFYFYLDTLEAFPDALAQKISLVVAAPITDGNAYQRLENLKNKFRQVTIHNGYKQDQLKYIKYILENVNLGIVPVLWEDNLPQVALEFSAYGIPVLTSDLGGAQEITVSDLFIFKAGDKKSFIDRVQSILESQDSLLKFWPNKNDKRILTSVKEHCNTLKNNYYC